MRRKQKVNLLLTHLKKLFPEVKSELEFTHDYEFLFAVIMSAQTTDKQVNKLTKKLFLKYANIQAFANADLAELQQDMSSIGLFRAKARNIKTAANLIVGSFNSQVPQTMQDLLSIPGAARKTANVVLYELFGIQEGIAVDTHVVRLSKNFGLTKFSDPKRIENDLMKIVPKTDWGDFTHRFILYGRYYYPAHKYLPDDNLADLVIYPNKRKRKNKNTPKS